ncbi:MAG: hypothetical protein QMD95_02245 [Candidatus Hodarchaeaceae archaeon]|nr:hypothetical protein [Candidatus Hodarchaeaceae archaeon]
MEADISKLKDPVTGESPPENYQTVYDNFKTVFDYSFKLRFPTGSSSNWSALDGSKFTFTMTTGPFQEFQSDPTQVMTYPGFGGPDVTLDFTLSEDGTVTATPILDFPPGMGSPAGTTGAPPSCAEINLPRI